MLSAAGRSADGLLFTDPLESRTPPSGLGIFWRRASFELAEVPATGCAGSSDGAAAPDKEERPLKAQRGSGAADTVLCGHSLASADPSKPLVAFNVDMEEHWHPLTGEGAAREKMVDADRRSAALLRLRHVSGEILWLCAAHLMTTARDGPKTNRYPGEVRAAELAALRQLVSRHVTPDPSTANAEPAAPPALLVMGDFNTPPSRVDVFGGRVRAHGPPAGAAAGGAVAGGAACDDGSRDSGDAPAPDRYRLRRGRAALGRCRRLTTDAR